MGTHRYWIVDRHHVSTGCNTAPTAGRVVLAENMARVGCKMNRGISIAERASYVMWGIMWME
jgi:hypothetical protein